MCDSALKKLLIAHSARISALNRIEFINLEILQKYESSILFTLEEVPKIIDRTKAARHDRSYTKRTNTKNPGGIPGFFITKINSV